MMMATCESIGKGMHAKVTFRNNMHWSLDLLLMLSTGYSFIVINKMAQFGAMVLSHHLLLLTYSF